jgi:ABC-type amino acid transport substrate-binding protein
MLWLLAIVVSMAAGPSQAAPVLRVGVADGSQPCSYRQRGSWSGMAVELWQQVADQEQIPYVLVPADNTTELLAATKRNEVDVAIGCITISPERIRQNRFSLPFQESGLGVMVKRNQLELGSSLLRSLLTPDLIVLLVAYVVLIGLLSVAVWQVERNGSKPSSWEIGPRRAFALIFQVLATGPGTNTVVVTTRGTPLSLWPTWCGRGNQELASRNIRSLKDLAGQRVAVRRGTVSDDLLQRLNDSGLQPPIQLRELDQVIRADSLLAADAVDAVLADDIQLDFLLQQLPHKLYGLALRNLNPQSQAFALSPGISEDLETRINEALGRLKRDGVVTRLRQQAMNKS